MKYKLILFLTVIAFTACNKNNPNSPDMDNYTNNDPTDPAKTSVSIFPDKIGSYWIYELTDLDSNNKKVPNSLSYDSVIVNGELKIADKKAKLFVTFSKTIGSYSKSKDSYYYTETGKVFTLQDYLSVFMNGIPFDLVSFSNTEWIKLIDTEDDLWRMYRQTFENAGIPGLPLVTMSGKVDILSSWESKKSLKINGTSFDAEEYLITLSMDADINIPIFGKQHISLDRELYQYYVKNIGLVKSVMNSAGITVPLAGEIKLPGFESILTKYKIEN